MSRVPALTTTSYAILSLLAVKAWSTYELTQQMDRSVGRIWPRATSKLYDEPKKLVAHGLAKAEDQRVGRRPRTVYSITVKGRRALAVWLQSPGAGPVLEFEQLLKVTFAENGTKADALQTLKAARSWAEERNQENLAAVHDYAAGVGSFQERAAQNHLAGRFLTDFYAMVAQWAEWAGEQIGEWPDNPRDALPDQEALEETARRAEWQPTQTLTPCRRPHTSEAIHASCRSE
jgi:PadR family transcriptional regulator AphA